MFLRTRRAQVTALVFGLVVALAGLGVGYGLWYKVLTIGGEVNTGTVHGYWLSAVTTDPPGSNDLKDTAGNRYEKDVGELECTIDTGDPEILHFTINNGYPSYYADCEVAWINDGSIPVNVAELRAGPAAGPLVPIPFDVFNDLDLDGDGEFDINLMVENGLGTQIDPGDKDAYSVWVHVKQAAPQDETLEFKVEFQLNQWNHP